MAKIHSSSKRKKEPKASFSMGFRSYVRHLRGQFWGFSVLQRHGVLLPGGDFFHGVFPFGDRIKRWPKFIAAARGKRSQKHHFLWVSEVTLGIFGVQFWGFSVLQRHGVFPSGDQQQQQQKFLQKQEVSEVTIGIFGVQFWGFSVLQRHGVSMPGGYFFHGVFPFGDRM